MSPLNENIKPDTTIDPTPIVNRESIKDKLLEELHKIFTGEEANKHYHEYLTKKKERPEHWKRLSNVPYYKERFALELKVVLDAMILDGQDREYRYADFPDTKRNTIYLRVNQAKLYLLEELDFDGRYHKLFQCITISRERTGIRLSFHKDVREGTGFMPTTVISNTSIDNLRSRIDQFISEATTGQKFEDTKVSIGPDEVIALRNSFVGLEGFVANITESSVKIIKL